MNKKWFELAIAVVKAFYKLIVGQEIEWLPEVLMEVSNIDKMFEKIIQAFEESIKLAFALTEENEDLKQELLMAQGGLDNKDIVIGQLNIELSKYAMKAQSLKTETRILTDNLDKLNIENSDLKHSKWRMEDEISFLKMALLGTKTETIDKRVLKSGAMPIQRIKALRYFHNDMGLVEAKNMVDEYNHNHKN